ncbi:MAG: hypothetical protein ACKOW5_02770 [Actinomycetales bacterium]
MSESSGVAQPVPSEALLPSITDDERADSRDGDESNDERLLADRPPHYL